MIDLFREHWQLALSAATFGADIAASIHALLNKRDARSPITWIGLIWLVPLGGSVLYFFLGINRVRRRRESCGSKAVDAALRFQPDLNARIGNRFSARGRNNYRI